MSAVLRHMALRLWLTALMGGLISMMLLPLWQRAMGIEFLVVPCLMILAGLHLALGWGMNRIGMHLLRRRIKEAAVWERAGMAADAQTAFENAVALFDSFWLSPLERKKQAPWFQGVLARYHLGPSSATSHARAVVAAYMMRYPQDAAVAEPWLEQLSIYPSHLPDEHEAATGVGRALADHPAIQQRLMQFYLTAGRFDFDARQTCQLVWQASTPLPDRQVMELCRLLLQTATLSNWALQVYLRAYAAGEAAALPGVAAAVRWLPPSQENREDLAAAKALLADTGDPELELTRRFAPLEILDTPRRKPISAGAFLPVIDKATKPVIAALNRSVYWLSHLARHKQAVRRGLSVVAVGVLMVTLGIGGWRLLQIQPKAPPEVKELPQIPVTTDPFTIQVAAYLSEADAQRFVDQLVQHGLAAFWTKAASVRRTWYQVKVSHFATKAEAQAYGNQLKARRLIDDFYVANYEPPGRQGH